MSDLNHVNDGHASAETAKSPEQTRRDFLNTFGKLALVTPVAMTVLMSPKTSAAPRSCKGWKKNQCIR